MGVPSAIKSIKSDCHWKKWISYEFFAKGLSGRKIELDKVIEPEQDEQSSAGPENVLEAATSFMALAPTMCCSTGHQSSYLTKLVVIKWQDLRMRYY
jgi:hypothetical protein